MSEDNSKNHDSSATHQRLQHSTTLNRRYVKRPEPMMRQEEADTAQPEYTESAETTAAVTISSFAMCQAENLRRRQELADKINHERALATQSKGRQHGQMLAESQAGECPQAKCSQKANRAKTIQVVAFDDEPEEEWEADEEEIDDMHWGAETGMADDQAEETALAVELALPMHAMAQSDQVADTPAQELPMQRAANARLAQTWAETQATQQPTAQELKDEAIRKAMRSVATMEAVEHKKETKKLRKHEKHHMQVRNRKRIALAIVCAVAVVGGIGYFVATNMPSVSYGAMAMQSGIDLSGLWVPRDFNLITSSAGEGSLSVTYAKGDEQFVLTAEVSTWDSQTLLNNYVTATWRGYDTVKEQGKTIYISGSNAAWVSGGIRYILEAKSGVLTNKQIKSIATSL